jgi:hypothetical protein
MLSLRLKPAMIVTSLHFLLTFSLIVVYNPDVWTARPKGGHYGLACAL